MTVNRIFPGNSREAPRHWHPAIDHYMRQLEIVNEKIRRVITQSKVALRYDDTVCNQFSSVIEAMEDEAEMLQREDELDDDPRYGELRVLHTIAVGTHAKVRPILEPLYERRRAYKYFIRKFEKNEADERW